MKFLPRLLWLALLAVAPCAGAWIEMTTLPRAKTAQAWSPPARGRGLKCQRHRLNAEEIMSPPARGRGLKSSSRMPSPDLCRRPLRGGVD